MKLAVRHTFPCTLDVFWQMFWDDDYDRMMQEATGNDRELLKDEQKGDERHWRMRFTPRQELPKMVAKATGAKKLIYEQTSRLDADRVLHWEVIPAIVPDKVTARGTMRAVPVQGGVDRIVDGEISVRIPLVGGRIEKAIHQSVLDGYENAYQVSLTWLRTRGLELS